MSDKWSFVHHQADGATWTEGLREIFEYRDLGGRNRAAVVNYVIAATGRVPNVAGLGLENTSLPLDERGTPVFDPETLRIGESHVFIAGDVTNDRPLLHEATDEGRIAGRNAGRYPNVQPGSRRSPLGIVFSDPQIAMAGHRYSELDESAIAIGVHEITAHRRDFTAHRRHCD